jgi:hypothetical protein
MDNVYDFYKPKLDSEYPVVDGPLYGHYVHGRYGWRVHAFRAKVASASKALNGHVEWRDARQNLGPQGHFQSQTRR